MTTFAVTSVNLLLCHSSTCFRIGSKFRCMRSTPTEMQSTSENDFECFASTGVNTPVTMSPNFGLSGAGQTVKALLVNLSKQQDRKNGTLLASSALRLQARACNSRRHAEAQGFREPPHCS